MSGYGHNRSNNGASERLAALFEQKQGVPISRDEIQEVADQLDYMKRLRRNGGARDILDKKGIALLWGKGDRQVIEKLGLGAISEKEFISYTPANKGELALLHRYGHSDLENPGFS